MLSDESATGDSGVSEEFENEEERKRKRKFMTKAALVVTPARRADEIFGQKIRQDYNNQKTCQSVLPRKKPRSGQSALFRNAKLASNLKRCFMGIIVHFLILCFI